MVVNLVSALRAILRDALSFKPLPHTYNQVTNKNIPCFEYQKSGQKSKSPSFVFWQKISVSNSTFLLFCPFCIAQPCWWCSGSDSDASGDSVRDCGGAR